MHTTVATPERRRATRKGGERWPEGIYVGRPGRFGNPYIVGRDGSAEDCIAKYRELLLGEGLPMRKGPRITVEIVRDALAGKHLICWCPLDRPCHADVLLQIANNA